LRKDWEEHSKTCLHRPIVCKCGNTIKFIDIEKHENECAEAIIGCDLKCDITFPRKDINNHLEICPNLVLDCMYSMCGCEAKVERKDMDIHLNENISNHLTMITNDYKDLKEKFKIMKEKNIELNCSNIEMKEGLLNLVYLKPNVPFNPLNSYYVILPTKMVDRNNNELVYIKDKGTVVGVGQMPRTIFGKPKDELKPFIVNGNKIIGQVHSSRNSSILYYFEVTINKVGNGEIYVGLANKYHQMTGILGQEDSYAYKSSGFLYRKGEIMPYGILASNGHVIGCGWDQRTGFLFFTHNGEFMAVAAYKVMGEYFPAVGINGYEIEVNVNLGFREFKYDCRRWLNLNPRMVKFEDSLFKQNCTFTGNGYMYMPQYYYNCKTCNLVDHYGVCEVCIKTCHSGHAITGPVFSHGFYCDCGAETYEKKRETCKSIPEDFDVKIIEIEIEKDQEQLKKILNE